MEIIKENGIPIYFQLANSLRQKIIKREFISGQALPSENELTAEYNISRGTVRKALQLLMQDGIIETYPGKGSVVTPNKMDYNASRSMGFFSKFVKDSGKNPTAIVMEKTLLQEAPLFVKSSLMLNDEEEVLFLRRLRCVDNEPWVIESTYLRTQTIGDKLVLKDFSKSIYAMLQNDYKISFLFSENSIGALIADEEKAKILEINSGDPLMRIKRIVYNDKKIPFEYAEDIVRADRLRFSVNVDYQSEEPIFKYKTNESINI